MLRTIRYQPTQACLVHWGLVLFEGMKLRDLGRRKFLPLLPELLFGFRLFVL